MSLTEEQQNIRSNGIGSSEIAMLVIGDDGKPLSPWGGPHKLWRIKTGQEIKEDISNEPQIERGEFLEPALLKWYAKRSGNKIKSKPGTRRHPMYNYVVDSVDALAWRPGEEKPYKCVEAKTTAFFMKGEYGEVGTDAVPKHYAVQGQWHMGAWGLGECDYPVFWGQDLNIYTSKHDEELWLCLVSIAEKFWKDHVETGKAPPLEPTEESSKWLSRHFAQSDKAKVREANADETALMQKYMALKMQHEQTEAQLYEVEHDIKERIGEDSGLHFVGNPKAKVTWNTVKGRASVAYDQLLADLAAKHGFDVDAIKKQYTKDGAPYRRFLATGLWSKAKGE